MNTIIETPTPEAVCLAGKILSEGGVVAFPTETVYGLGADGLNPEAVKKIYAAKGRPSDNPLILHIATLDTLSLLAENIPQIAYELADRFWPGPLTMILRKQPVVPDIVTAGLPTVAVRMPENLVARRLIDAAETPLAAPSANLSGSPSPTLAQHVAADFSGRIEMIIDGGPCRLGIESTVVDLSSHKPQILRAGSITMEMLEEVIGPLSQRFHSQQPKAPGMKYRHYAPKAQLSLVLGESAAVSDEIIKTAALLSQRGTVRIFATEETAGRYHDFSVCSLGSLAVPETVAANLFNALRQCDQDGVEFILAEGVCESGVGVAVMDRLRKAAKEIINV